MTFVWEYGYNKTEENETFAAFADFPAAERGGNPHEWVTVYLPWAGSQIRLRQRASTVTGRSYP